MVKYMGMIWIVSMLLSSTMDMAVPLLSFVTSAPLYTSHESTLAFNAAISSGVWGTEPSLTRGDTFRPDSLPWMYFAFKRHVTFFIPFICLISWVTLWSFSRELGL